MGHRLGVTIGATMLGLALPLAIEVLPIGEAQALYREGFRFSALAVVWIMISGGIVAMFQQIPQGIRRRRSAEPAPQASGGDG
jgi:hypothetical protein